MGIDYHNDYLENRNNRKWENLVKNDQNIAFSRRKTIALLLSSFAVPSFAISTGGAENFVMKATKEIERIVNSGSTGSALTNQVRQFFHKYADVPSIARAVIGAPWRGMSAAQQKQYVSAFEGYVIKKYGSRLKELQGGKGELSRTVDKGAAGVQVDINFVWSGYEPRKVVFLVSDGSGSPKVLDLKVLGISLLSAERIFVRQAFTHSNNDVDKLIDRLKR